MRKVKLVLGLGIALGVIGGTFLAAFGVLYVKPYMDIRTMVRGSCMTGLYDVTGDVVHCTCANYGTGSCVSRYMCVKVFVNFTMEDGGVRTNVTLYDSYETYILQKNKLQCSYHKCSRDEDVNQAAVAEFLEEYGETKSDYDCYYEPSDLSYAIVSVVERKTIIHCMLWPSLALLTGFIILLVYLNDSSQDQNAFNSLERPWLRQQARYECIVNPGEANAAAVTNSSGHGPAQPSSQESRGSQNLSHSTSSPVAQLI